MNKETVNFFVYSNGNCNECIAQFTSFFKGFKYNDDNEIVVVL